MLPPRTSTVSELKALGRKEIIARAKEAAREAGSHMVPADDKGVRVFTSSDAIKIVLAKGYRAYTDGKVRRIETCTLVVQFEDQGDMVTHEGDDVLTEDDERILKLVLKNMPPNYSYIGLTIIDNPDEEPTCYIVELDGEDAMGRHGVNRRSGQWTYITHKHYARSHGIEKEEWEEMK